MNLIYFLLILLSSILTIFTLYYLITKLFGRIYLFSNYKKVIDLFEYFLQKSYDLTYENSIVHWVANGVPNIQPEEKETIERDFIRQTFLLMGDNNRKLFRQFYSDDTHIITMMILYIRKRISNDGLATIVKTGSNNLNQIT